MYAQCPNCLTFFHLKPSHLKAAGGKVRCSRCKHVFNALETLRDALSEDEIAAVKAAQLGSGAEKPRESREEYAGDLFDGLEYTENNELGLAEPEAAPPEEQPASEEQPGVPAREALSPDMPAAIREIEDFTEPRPRRRHTWLLAVLNILLLLLVGAQLLHAQRYRLLEHPQAGPFLAQAYDTLQIPLEMPRELDALRISRTEVATHAEQPDALRLTAVLENTGRRAQPWPELYVELQDRWGESVGARYFAPAEYLRDVSAADEPLPSRRRAAVELAIIDPGNDAVGFQVEPCFRNNGRPVCQSDLDD